MQGTQSDSDEKENEAETWKCPGDQKYYQINCLIVKQCFRNSEEM
jgi:hypothetical protein